MMMRLRFGPSGNRGANENEEDDNRIDSNDSEEESLTISDSKVEELTKVLPQSSDKTTAALDSALATFQPRWRNWTVRLIFTLLMIYGFMLIIYMGPLALMTITIMVQVKSFHEVVSVGYAVYSVHRFPWFRSLSWYFLFISNYFFYGENLINYFGILNRLELMQFLVAYHRFISFSLYLVGFVWFVLSLVKKYYMRQFNLFAWTHIAILILVTTSYLILRNMFEALIWFIVPVSMVICNDIFAYICGFFFGRTPLIKLSPKKTWEGFIGGAIFTVIFGVIESHIVCQFKYFICPVEYSDFQESAVSDCVPSPLFQLTEYQLPSFLVSVLTKLGYRTSVHTYPFVLHSLALSLFSSIIGPFGGFFASGFKRAFKVKDFGDVIPGHGGITDRFDCQLLMATFVHVYIHSFIKSPCRSPDLKELCVIIWGSNTTSVLNVIYKLDRSVQLDVFRDLNKTLNAKGLL